MCISKLIVDDETKLIVAESGYSYGSFKNSDNTHFLFINESHVKEIMDKAIHAGFNASHA